ncbi:hypothetical protein J6590_107828 [Homalodisca vitripennis]|nr:hypothetical protein J6590_107828 [Homalodisca vitripennis]
MITNSEDLIKIVTEILDLPSKSDEDPKTDPVELASESDIDPTTNFVQLPSECDFEQVSEAESNTHTSAVSDHNIEAVGLNILSSNVLSKESENEYFTESDVSSKTTSFVDSSSEADDTDEDPNYIPSDVESNNSEEIEQSSEEELVLNLNQPSTSKTTQAPPLVWSNDTKPIPVFEFNNSSTGIKLQLPENATPYYVFNKLWSDEIMNMICQSINNYGILMDCRSRPHAKG